MEDAREGSAEYRMIVRQMHGLKKSEIGGLILEFAMNYCVMIPGLLLIIVLPRQVADDRHRQAAA